MKLCPIQEICRHYTNGTKRKVHHIRISEPCNKWLSMDCEMGVSLRLWMGEVIACELGKIRRMKGGN